MPQSETHPLWWQQPAHRMECLGLLGVLLVMGLLYGFLLTPEATGLMYDDAAYLLAAKALANGQGYRLIGVEGEPFLTKYPPLYALVLSLGWMLNSHFPHNIPLLACINITLTLLSLLLTFIYSRWVKGLSAGISLLIVSIIGIHFQTCLSATGFWSEPLYLVLSLLLMGWAELRSSQPIRLGMALGLGVLGALLFYTRTIGALAALSVAAALFINRHRPQALAVGLTFGLLIVPWLLCSVGQPTPPIGLDGHFAIRQFTDSYASVLQYHWQLNHSPLTLIQNGLWTLAGQSFLAVHAMWALQVFFSNNLWGVTLSLISCALFALGCYKLLKQLWKKPAQPSTLYLLTSFLVIGLWPYPEQNLRFLWVLLPFLLTTWVVLLQQAVPKGHPTIAGLLILLLVANGAYTAPLLAKETPNDLSLVANETDWDDYQATAQFISSKTPPDATLWANADPLFFSLYTGRTAVDYVLEVPLKRLTSLMSSAPMPSAQQPNPAEAVTNRLLLEKSQLHHQRLQQHHVDYVILFAKEPFAMPAVSLYPDQTYGLVFGLFPHAYQPVFTSPHGWIQVYQTCFSAPACPNTTPSP